MTKQKINVAVGRFQPFTLGHLNMVNEGGLPCIIYQMLPPELPNNINELKVKNLKVKSSEIKNVIEYINTQGKTHISEKEKELLKRPFTGSLIAKEMEIVKRNNKNIIDVVYVNNAFEGIARFNKFILDNQDKYEAKYWLCGDDRINDYQKTLDKYIASGEALAIERNGEKYDNVISSLQLNTGKGRTEGISGTAVRKSIITNDKATFSNIMPKGVSVMFDEFTESFNIYIEKLKQLIKECKMTSLTNFLIENVEDIKSYFAKSFITEGGAGGHMAHPIDYTDFTGEELINLVSDLFSGKVETMKEKLDGMNINATMNEKGEVVFVRGNADRNSPKGGMSIDDMATKWEGKEHQLKVYLQSGKIIDQIFSKLDVSYFNPKPGVRKIINCECIIEGKTNVLPYAKDRVAFHGYKIYELTDKLDKNGNKSWKEIEEVEGDVDAIYAAAEGIDAAKPRPNLIIKSVEEGQKFVKQFTKAISKLFTDEGLKLTDSINDWKLARFNKVKPEWMNKNVTEIFNRWFNGDNSFKASDIKKTYPDHYEEVKGDKFCKLYITNVMQPLDNLFLAIGNELIDLLNGFTNSASHNAVVDILKNDMTEVIELVKQSGSTEIQDKVEKNLNRLQALNNKYNSAEGIVFMYKGRLMKLTGSFAAINQILGARFDVEKLNKIV